MAHQGSLGGIDWSLTFYRLMESSVNQDRKMRIPGKFGKKFGNEFTRIGSLMVPNGCVWKVVLEKVDDKFWFTNGWHEFIKHHSVGVGQLLVFAYVGNTSFRVNIYDLATAEVKYQCHTLHNSEDRNIGKHVPLPYKEGYEDDDAADILKPFSPCESSVFLQNKFFDGALGQQTADRIFGPPMKGNLVKSQFVSDLENIKCDRMNSSSDGRFGHCYPVENMSESLADHRGMREADQVKQNRVESSNAYGFFLDQKQENNKPLARTLENFKTVVPYMECNLKGNELNNSTYKANGGSQTSTKEVDIRQPVGRTRDVGIQCVYDELMTASYQIKLHSLNQRPEMTKKRKKTSRPRELVKPAAKRASDLQSPGAKTSIRTIVRRWREVTPEEKERVTNASKAFQSEYPFCRVVLRRSYIYKGIGLHMPSSFADKYLTGVTGFLVLQVRSGEKWPVRCLWRDGSAKLSKGWPEFVWDNKLEEGDVCIFELIDMKDVVLCVTIFHVHEDAEPINKYPKNNVIQTGQTSQFSISYDLNG